MDVILKPKLGHDCYSDGHPVEGDGQDGARRKGAHEAEFDVYVLYDGKQAKIYYLGFNING